MEFSSVQVQQDVMAAVNLNNMNAVHSKKNNNTAPAAPLQNTKQAEAGKPLAVPQENTTLRRALMKSVMSPWIKGSNHW